MISIKEKFVVLGYYHRDNLGDDMFEHIFNEYFQRFWPDAEYIIANTHEITRLPEGTTAVIFGGGGIIGDYFVNKLKKIMKDTPNSKHIPIYGIGIGIPYRSVIEKGYLDNLDYIVHRCKTDQEELLERYGKNRVSWFPDISYLLTKYHPENKSIIPTLEPEFQQIYKGKTKKIGVFLTRTIFNVDNVNSYQKIVGQISNFLIGLAEEKRSTCSSCISIANRPKYDIYLFPFCDTPKLTQDDRIINRDVYEKINEFDQFDNVHLITKKPTMEQLLTVFGGFYATVCSRFHAHMFSLMTHTPVLSVFTTRKVHNILEEFNLLNYGIKMETNEDEVPISVNTESMKYKWKLLTDNYCHYRKDLEVMNVCYREHIKEFETLLTNLLFYKFRGPTDSYLSLQSCEKSNEIADKIICKFKLNTLNETVKKDIRNKTGTLHTIFQSGGKGTIEKIADIISYSLTGVRKSIYHWGLTEKVLTDSYNLKESCAWILCDFFKYNDDACKLLQNPLPRNDRKFNSKFINSNLYKGYHRSGWNFVLQHLDNLHNPNGTIFDSYADKTFGWDENFLESTKVVPYTKPWVGVFHHTPNTDYSEHNMVNVFKKQSFLDSLHTCKGIIVFSDYLKNWIEANLNVTDIPVLKMFHPSEELSSTFQFNFDKFKSQSTKKVLQIGGWLRNSYAIYELPQPNGFDKYVLKWIGMNNYFVDDVQFGQIQDSVVHIGEDHENCCGHIVYDSQNKNKYVLGLRELIRKNHDSVIPLEMTPNEEFDMLLTSSVVFINLVDASAVNTILECIMRNTPICVNRLPAVEEYLGEDYPLYYETLEEASKKISNEVLIHKAHLHLKNMSKQHFTINYFLQQLKTSHLYQIL